MGHGNSYASENIQGLLVLMNTIMRVKDTSLPYNILRAVVFVNTILWVVSTPMHSEIFIRNYFLIIYFPLDVQIDSQKDGRTRIAQPE